MAGRFDAQVRWHIERYVRGPANYTEERVSTSSNVARNIAFELLVMARLAASGLDLDFSIQSDIAATFDNNSLIFECKRPQSLKKLGARIKDAFKQLERKYSNFSQLRRRGVIAVDITKVVNPDFMLYVKPDALSLERGIANIVDQFIVHNAHYWQIGRNKKTIAVMFRLSLIGVNKERNDMLTYCQQYGMTPLNHSGQRNIETAKALTDALS